VTGENDEFVKIILVELRKTTDRIDTAKDDIYTKLDATAAELKDSQKSLHEEHGRMNNLLEDHMRRTQAVEDTLDVLKETTAPAIKDHEQRVFLQKYRKELRVKVGKYLAIISAIVAIVGGLLKLV
jgi:septal ring factor EnvC (AmiA/AmiB activator)